MRNTKTTKTFSPALVAERGEAERSEASPRGVGANHDVPISIVAHDPSVFSQISSWDWQDGLMPSPSAPLWPMDAFRNKFLTAYSNPVPTTTPAAAARPHR